jgi:hypothetical protein
LVCADQIGNKKTEILGINVTGQIHISTNAITAIRLVKLVESSSIAQDENAGGVFHGQAIYPKYLKGDTGAKFAPSIDSV